MFQSIRRVLLSQEILGTTLAVLALAAHATAQEKTAPRQDHLRIGLKCSPLPEILRDHLPLAEREGVLVQEVVAGGPAEEAGLMKHDVLVAVDGELVHNVAELLHHVQASQGEPTELRLLRRGQQVTVTVTPRPAPALPPHPTDALRHLMRKQYQEVPADGGVRDHLFRRRGPMMMFPGHATLPKNVEVRVRTDEEGKTQITIQQDDKQWEVTSDNPQEAWEKVPAELRPHLAPFAHASGMVPPPGGITVPWPPVIADPLARAAEAIHGHLPQVVDREFDVRWTDENAEVLQTLQERVAELQQRLDAQAREMQSWMKAMQDHLPAPTPPSAPDAPDAPDAAELPGTDS